MFWKYHNQLIFNFRKSGSWREGNNWTSCSVQLWPALSTDKPRATSHSARVLLSWRPHQSTTSELGPPSSRTARRAFAIRPVTGNRSDDSLTSKQALSWIDEAFFLCVCVCVVFDFVYCIPFWPHVLFNSFFIFHRPTAWQVPGTSECAHMASLHQRPPPPLSIGLLPPFFPPCDPEYPETPRGTTRQQTTTVWQLAFH